MKNKKPIWKRSILSQAIVLAGVSMQVSAGISPPCSNVTGTRTSTCYLTGSDTATVTSSGVISVTSGDAINVSASGSNNTITNSGTISSDTGAGVYYQGDMDGDLTNNVDATISASASSSSAYGIYIDNDLSGTLDNSGTITATATATGSSSSNAYAYGVNIDSDLSGTLDNSGTISATATGSSSSDAYAYGVHVYYSVVSGGTLNNSGTISASASASSYASAYGVYVDDYMYGSLDNSGTISATASASNAYAYGIYLSSTMYTGSALTNSGSISATASGSSSASAYGVYLDDDMYGTLDNSGTINVSATASGSGGSSSGAYAAGIYLYDIETDAVLTNSGSISATANGSSSADAYGIRVDDIGADGTLINSDSITATATGSSSAEAYGIRVDNMFYSSSAASGAALTNSGSISASASASGSGSARARGIELDDMRTAAVLTNSGSISATASGAASATATGIYVSSLYADATLTNSGSISASATADGSAEAYGIYIDYLSGTLDNSGSITASASGSSASAYAVYVGGVGEGAVGSFTNTGTVNGNIYLGSTVGMTNRGTLSIPTGEVGYIGGNYTQSGDGVLEVGARSGDEYGQLEVAGTADISANGKLAVAVDANDTLVDGDVLNDVLTAGTLISGDELTVADNSALWNFTATEDGNTIDLAATFVSVEAIVAGTEETEDTFDSSADSQGAGEHWAIPVAQTIDAIYESGTASGDMADVLGELNALSSAGEVVDAVSQMVPVVAGNAAQAVQMALNGVSSAISTGSGIAGNGLSSGDELLPDTMIWIKPFGTNAEQDKRDGVAGYDADSYGVAMGVDGQLSEQWRVGAALAISRGNIDGKSTLARQSLDIDGYQAVIYGNRSLDANSYLKLQGALGFNSNDSRRGIQFGGINRVAEADYDSWYGQLQGEAGRRFALTDNLSLTSAFSLAYTYIDEESYTEKGAGALNLSVDDRDEEALVLGLDGELSYLLPGQGQAFVFTAHAGVAYDVLADRAEISSTFSGGGPVFSTEGIEPDALLLRGGLGVTLATDGALELSANYDVEAREDFLNQMFSINARFAF